MWQQRSHGAADVNYLCRARKIFRTQRKLVNQFFNPVTCSFFCVQDSGFHLLFRNFSALTLLGGFSKVISYEIVQCEANNLDVGTGVSIWILVSSVRFFSNKNYPVCFTDHDFQRYITGAWDNSLAV